MSAHFRLLRVVSQRVVGSVRVAQGSFGVCATRPVIRRWLASPAQGELGGGKTTGGGEAPAGPDPTQLIQKSKEAADQVKALGGRSWYQWYQEHQDELLVVLLSSLFLLSTLRLYRTKGEHLDDKKEHERKVKELEDKITALKKEIRASIECGAEKVAIVEGGVWSSRVPAMRAALLQLVDAGIANVENPARGEPAKEEEAAMWATPTAELEQRKPVKPKGII